MVAPSGEQYEISAGGYRAVVTECGGGLRLLEYDGRPLVEGYDETEHASAGRGQLLVPWPNRIEDGAYTFADRNLQLPISEVARFNASHGLARWAAWTLEEQTGQSVSLLYRLMAQSGYPWTVDLHVLYDVSADGLTVTVTATNLSDSPAPYALGAHPYLIAGDDGIDAWELTLPAGGTGACRRNALRLPCRATHQGPRARRRVHRPDPRAGRSRRGAAAQLTNRSGRPGLDGRRALLGAGLQRRRPGAGQGAAFLGDRADDLTRQRVSQRRGPHCARPGWQGRHPLLLLGYRRTALTKWRDVASQFVSEVDDRSDRATPIGALVGGRDGHEDRRVTGHRGGDPTDR